MMQQQPVLGLLPAPRLPGRPTSLPRPDLVAAVAGEKLARPLRAAEEVSHAAAQAMRDLEECRPGGMGKRWRQAVDADAEALAAGKRPRKYVTATLLEADTDRWAHAAASCRAVARAWQDAAAHLDRTAIAKACRTSISEHGMKFAAAAAAGWNAREDRGQAWGHHDAAARHLAEIGEVRELLAQVDSKAEGLTSFPADPIAHGHWLALQISLDPNRNRLLTGIPKDVVWPEGAEDLVPRAIGTAVSFTDLRERGYHETKEVPA